MQRAIDKVKREEIDELRSGSADRSFTLRLKSTRIITVSYC